MFELLSIYCLFQKRLVEIICYSEIVKPDSLLRKSSISLDKDKETGLKYST